LEIDADFLSLIDICNLSLADRVRYGYNNSVDSEWSYPQRLHGKCQKIKRFNSPYIKYRYIAVQNPTVAGFPKQPDGADDGL